jgi:DNA-binding response OmpR family regulator
MKILLVDDDPDESVIFRDAVEQLGEAVHVSQVYYCHELYDLLKKATFDLIILDINLPLVNGIECLKKVRGDSSLPQLPIIMFSNVINQLNIDLSYQHKANYFFIKPNTIDDIKIVVRILMDTNWDLKEQVKKEDFLIQY